MGKYLKDIRGATLRVDLWGLFENPHGGREDKKDVRIGSVSEKRKSLALGRDQIKLTEQCQVPQGMGNLTRGIKSWSDCANW